MKTELEMEKEYNDACALAESELDHKIADKCFGFSKNGNELWLFKMILSEFIPSIIKVNNNKFKKFKQIIYDELLNPIFGDPTCIIIEYLI